jgi:hypothetical protein
VLRADDGEPLGIRPVETLRVQPPRPNPFRSSATLEFTTPETQPVRVDLYDTLGRLVRTVFTDEVEANRTESIALNTAGLASGIYFVRVRAGGTQRVVRAAVVR